MTFKPSTNISEIRIEQLRKSAFLIHSSKEEEKDLLNWFRILLQLYGVSTLIIEEDSRSNVDWLQKSLDGIEHTNFVLAFLTKRYQFLDDNGQARGWKAPDKCYDEIAIAFARKRDLFALVEKSVDPGMVLEQRAWCYEFHREPSVQIDIKLFQQLDSYMGNLLR
ncbi:toll/interleukin-1 receptor domain-containing protein [Candidatus Bathyarchaeota archaeon]|nr:toll/interleukin-1 receptor domain-containing protein [Candidatus Bathyarchaeota archaeon]